MSWTVTLFSLLVSGSGWYYMLYSRNASILGSIEDQRINLRRQRLRRFGGFVMFLLGVALFAGFNTVDPHRSAAAFVAVWTAVFVLLMVIVVLALVDLRLTWRLRKGRRV